MTIIRPNRNKNIKRFIYLWGGLTAGMLGAVIFSYLSLVEVKHDLRETREGLEEAKVINAELKNEYYQITSAENFEQLAGEIGLIKDKNPQWLVASQY